MLVERPADQVPEGVTAEDVAAEKHDVDRQNERAQARCRIRRETRTPSHAS